VPACLVVILTARVAGAPAGDSVAAFPGAEGFGAKATGGRGGRVLFVDSLLDNPREPSPGTFRWACERESGPRIVVFRTGGIIELARPVEITHPNVTIAGQTAPGDGVCLKGSQLSIQAGNVIVRGLRSRPGDGDVGISGQYRRCLEIIGDVSDVIVDHCSLSWGVDETITVYGDTEGRAPRDVTIQWCLLAEGLADSIHQQGSHSCAVNFGGGNVRHFSLHHNVLAHHGARNPRVVWSATGEILNNVIYNWGGQACIVQPHNPVKIKRDKRRPSETDGAKLNVIGNYWIPGPDSDDGPEILLKLPTPGTLLYLEGNSGPSRPLGTRAGLDETAIIRCPGPQESRSDYLSEDRIEDVASGVRSQPLDSAKAEILGSVGALAPARDAVDRRVVDEIERGGGRIIDSPADVGGYPDYHVGSPPPDADNDGMPDAWEDGRQLDKTTASANGRDLDPDYDNIEVYVNGLFASEIQP
jgi:pectate lyase